jgi:hypothetical protein
VTAAGRSAGTWTSGGSPTTSWNPPPEKYTYYLAAYILPVLGSMRMTDIFPEHVHEWIAIVYSGVV